VAIVIRPAGFEAAVEDALRCGARAIVAITSGLGERDAAGLAVQETVVSEVRAAGAVLLGPNCLGIADTGTMLDLTWDNFGPGSLGLISQSGNLGLELAQLARDAGIGFSRFISIGNQADLDASECLAELIEHEPTRTIAIYLEDFRDGRRFAATADASRRMGKPVILLTVGRSRASARTAHSHTGGLVSDSVAVDAACRASGIYRVETPQQMIDLAQLLSMPHQSRGRRIGIVGDGGGHVALGADRLTARGLLVEPFTDRLAAELADGLPVSASTTNPVDIAGGGEEDVHTFERVVRRITASGEADAVLLTGYFGGYSQQSDEYRRVELEVAEALAVAVEATGTPLVIHSMYPRSPTSVALRARGVALYGDIEAAAAALGHLAGVMVHLPLGMPADASASDARELPPDSDYFAARQLVGQAGITLVEARPVGTEEEAIGAAAELGYPVVLKALGRLHKSDSGGVRLGVRDAATLRRAFGEMQAGLRPQRFSVEREAARETGIELLVGVKRNRGFGPIALVGFGGLYTEVLQDIAVALAPLTVEQAARLMQSLRAFTILTGKRGRPAVDVEAAAHALSALSQLAARVPGLHELEVNPLLVLPNGAVALDARMVTIDLADA
jgi:acyl-CoA synthetase (NDP forming)